MSLTLSAAHIQAIAWWLPTNTVHPAGARALLFDPTYPELDRLKLELLQIEVRGRHSHFRGGASVLNAPFAMRGDGGPVRPPEDGPGCSLWEWAWLIIDREDNTADAFAALRSEYKGHPVLNIVGVVLLASATLDEARERARVLAALPSTTWVEGMHDRGPWVQWLAGNAPLPKVSATPGDDVVVAALNDDWSLCERLARRAGSNLHPPAIRLGAEHLMHRHLVRAIWSYYRGHADITVLKRSLATIFSHWGKTKTHPWHAGINVGSRLPLLGMIAHVAHENPLALLHEQRNLNRHLMEPPARYFTMPRIVEDAFTAFDAMVTAALEHGGRFARTFTTTQDLVLAPLSPPVIAHATAQIAGDGAPQVHGAAQHELCFRVNPSETSETFILPRVSGETVAQLKKRVSARAGPHDAFFVLQVNGRPLKLVETVDAVLGAQGATFDVLWTRCSHGAPTHPITGDSMCFWDGSETAAPEY